jgi:hypothetical protein
VPIYGSFWSDTTPSGGGGTSPVCPKCGAEYTTAQKAMHEMYGITEYGAMADVLGPGEARTEQGYIDLRGCITSVEAMAKCLEVSHGW